MARVIFVNRFYWPDETATGQLLTDLAESLASRGHEVTAIASRPPGIRGGDGIRNGVRIVHVGSSRLPRGSVVSKAVDFGTFFIGACWALLHFARRGTVVVAMTDPPLLGIGAWVVARLRHARLVQWVQDIYPEIAIELAGQRWLGLIRPARNAAWRGADHCVALGDDMAAHVRQAAVPDERIAVIPNWAPAGLTSPDTPALDELRTRWDLAGKFVVVYSGNLGRVHDLEPVLDVAAVLQKRANIVFIFVGGGAQRQRLEQSAARRGLTNVLFRPPQPRAGLATALAVADVHLVSIRPGCEALVFPSKLYGIAAVGRPVIFIGPTRCEVAQCVVKNNFGYAHTRDDADGMARAIEQLAAQPAECARLREGARRFAERHSAESAADRWSELIGRVADSPRQAGRGKETPKP